MTSRQQGVVLFVLAMFSLLPSCSRETLTPHVAEFEVPTAIVRLEMRDGKGETLWRIESAEGKELETLDWGLVPPSYRQVHPAAGPPRPLRSGEPLMLVYITGTSWFRHEGHAVGTSGFLGGFYAQGTLSNTPIEKAFAKSMKVLPED